MPQHGLGGQFGIGYRLVAKGQATGAVGAEPAPRGFIEGNGHIRECQRAHLETQPLPFGNAEGVVVHLGRLPEAPVNHQGPLGQGLSLGGQFVGRPALPVAGLGVHVKRQGVGKTARRDRPQVSGARFSGRIHLEPQAEQLHRLVPGVRLGPLFRLGTLLVPQAENGCPDTVGVEPQFTSTLQPTPPEGCLKLLSRPTSQGKQGQDLGRSARIGLSRGGEGLKQDQQGGNHPSPAPGAGWLLGRGHGGSPCLKGGQVRPDW